MDIVSAAFGPFCRILVLAILAFAYNVLYLAGEPAHTELVNTAIRMSLPLLVVWWIERDARQSLYWPAHHYALWLFSVWPIAVPHYVVRTRGRRGWPLALTLLTAIASPYLGWAIGVGLGLLIGTYAW